MALVGLMVPPVRVPPPPPLHPPSFFAQPKVLHPGRAELAVVAAWVDSSSKSRSTSAGSSPPPSTPGATVASETVGVAADAFGSDLDPWLPPSEAWALRSPRPPPGLVWCPQRGLGAPPGLEADEASPHGCGALAMSVGMAALPADPDEDWPAEPGPAQRFPVVPPPPALPPVLPCAPARPPVAIKTAPVPTPPPFVPPPRAAPPELGPARLAQRLLDGPPALPALGYAECPAAPGPGRHGGCKPRALLTMQGCGLPGAGEDSPRGYGHLAVSVGLAALLADDSDEEDERRRASTLEFARAPCLASLARMSGPRGALAPPRPGRKDAPR